MPLNLPEGKRLAVSIGPDFDAQAVWQGNFNSNSPSYLSRGEFDAEVGIPRLLNLFKKYDIRTTFFTPTHTMATFTDRFNQVLEAGHEIGAHGCYHEHVPSLEPDEERRLMEVTIGLHEKYVGKKPRGYRSPAWDFSEITMSLLEEWGFVYDSSLMGRDFDPYFPRPALTLDLEKGNTFGEPSDILEFPVSWYLDDFPTTEYIAGTLYGVQTIDSLLKIWIDQFDYAYANHPGGVFCLTVHPQCIGRAHHIVALEKFIQHVMRFDGAWFAPLGDVYDCWTNN